MKDKGVKSKRAYHQGFRDGWHAVHEADLLMEAHIRAHENMVAGRGPADRETSESDASSPDTIPDGSVGVSASDSLTPEQARSLNSAIWQNRLYHSYQESINPGFKDQQTLIDAAATIRELTDSLSKARSGVEVFDRGYKVLGWAMIRDAVGLGRPR